MSELEKYIENLKQRISEKGEMSELEIIRYVYIDLGRKMNFDLNYTFGNSKERNKIYYKRIDERELNKILEAQTTICKGLAYLLERILKEFGINIKTEKEHDNTRKTVGEHVHNVIIPKNGKKYNVDLEDDLEFIQSGAKTQSFGFNEDKEQIISDEELRRIDKEKAEYIPQGYYLEDMIWMLKKAVNSENINLEDKLKFVLENLNVYTDNVNVEYRERIKYYARMLESVFSEKEMNKIHQIDMFKKTKNGVECNNIIVLEKNQKEEILFLLSEETKKYKEISMNKIVDMMNCGFKAKSGIPGLKKYLSKCKEEDIEI